MRSTCGGWVARFGEGAPAEISDDEIFAALEELAEGAARYYAGKDGSGNPILRSRGRRKPATINRYHAALGALFRFAKRKRLTPRGWQNPTAQVERRREDNARVRFLSDEERARLLKLCRVSRWPKLYLIVLMALTTGARKGELQRLRWGDIDWARALAHIATSKNGEPRVLPLVPTVVAELERFCGARERLVFASTRRPEQPMNFESVWRIALAEARIPDFRFHDLGHTGTSYQQG